MATYKQGYKKQSAENILLKFIVGIIVTVVVIVGIVFVLQQANKWKEYSEYPAISNYAGIFEYTNGGTEELEDYVIYFYSTNSDSEDLRNSVLSIGRNLNTDENELFFIANSDAMLDSDTQLENFLTDIDEESLSTPLLVVVADGELYEAYTTDADIVETLESIEEGTFDPFN